MMPSTQQALKLRSTQASALRRLFECNPHRWFSNVELQQLTGMQRFVARIYELRRGVDGGTPLDIRKESCNETGSRWRYRCFGALERLPHQSAVAADEADLAHDLNDAATELMELRRTVAVFREDYARRGLPVPGVAP